MKSTAKIMYTANAENFSKIPGSPIAYWVSECFYKCFENKEPLDKAYSFREGIHTANNNMFLRLWYEVNSNKMVLGALSYEDIDKNGKWVPYNKGGLFRKWYGNNEYVIAFDRNSRNCMSQLEGHVRPSQDLYFLEGGTWTAVSSGNFGIRYYPKGFLFDAGGQVAVGKGVIFCIAFLNSVLFKKISEITMPTINFKCGVIKNLPNLCIETKLIENIAQDSIKNEKADWDSFETSWDFTKHPLLQKQIKNCRLY